MSDRPDVIEPPPHDAEPVAIRDFAYVPPEVTVRIGTTVVWTNDDVVPHSVTANDESFDSPVLTTGQRFQLTPTTPGTFPYFCDVHPNIPSMRGTLRVTE